MRYFPLLIDTHDLNVSVFGGGLVAESKVKLLLKSEARVTVFSSQLTPLLSELRERGRLQQVSIAAGELSSAKIEWARVRVAYDAFETPQEVELARQWLRDQCAEHKVLLNVVDQRALCQFITPALVDRDPITVAISTSGAAPMLSRLIRAQIEELLPEYIGELARWSEGHRPQVGETLPPGAPRRDFWAELFDIERPIGRRIVDALRAGDEERATRELYALLTEHRQRLSPQLGVDSPPLKSVEISTHSAHSANSARGELYLVGAGPGDPDLLTVRAAQTIGRADVIVTDRLVNPLIIERYARREAEVIYVGKDPRGRSTPQDEINQILVELAETSQVVVRLKGGDPMIFGRAVEELTALREAGFECEVIPGVSAAVAGSASLQLPLTQRQVHRQCVLATAMSCDGPVEHPWVELARSGSLLALYMSSRLAGRVESRLLEAGLDPDTPVTVAASISTPQQTSLWGSLHELSALAQSLSPHPMILYIGAHPLHSTRSYDVDRSLTPSLDPIGVTPAHRTTPLPLDRSTGGAAPVAWTCQPSDPDQRRRA